MFSPFSHFLSSRWWMSQQTKSTAMFVWSHRWVVLMDSAQLCIQFRDKEASVRCETVMSRGSGFRAVFQISDTEITNYQLPLSSRLIRLLWRSCVCSLAAATRVWLTYCCRLFLAAPFILLKMQTNASPLTWRRLSEGCWMTCTEHENLGKLLASGGYHFFTTSNIISWFFCHPDEIRSPSC